MIMICADRLASSLRFQPVNGSQLLLRRCRLWWLRLRRRRSEEEEKNRYSKHVFVVVPGGTDENRCLTRQMHYLFHAWPQESDWKLRYLQSWRNGYGALWVYCKALLRVLYYHQRGRLQLLHINISSHGDVYRSLIMGRLAHWMRLPYVLHFHGGTFHQFYDEASPTLQKQIEWLLYYSYHCVVLGAGWQHFLELRFRVPHEKISICYNASPDVKPAPKKSEPPLILFLGQVLPRKGIDELIDALAQLQHLPWRAIIAGSGRINDYRKRVCDLGLQTRIALPGWQQTQQAERLFAEADMLVLPSHIENQPLCVIEAMARGVTVITTNVGTLPEIIDHEQTGLLVSPHDETALAQAITRLLQNPQLRQEMAQAARHQYEAKFTLERYIRQWQSIYQQCLSG